MKKLSWTKRVAIEEGIQAGKTNAQIAYEIGVHRATIGREIARNAESRESYRARTADDASWKRQQEAMPKRFLVRFNGVEWLSTLNKRDQIYTYVSRTHLSLLFREFAAMLQAWDASYIRTGVKEQFLPDQFYERFRMFNSEPSFFGSGWDISLPSNGWSEKLGSNKESGKSHRLALTKEVISNSERGTSHRLALTKEVVSNSERGTSHRFALTKEVVSNSERGTSHRFAAREKGNTPDFAPPVCMKSVIFTWQANSQRIFTLLFLCLYRAVAI